MKQRRTEIIVTLGPSTDSERDLEKLKDKGIDFVRVNMSHSSIEDFQRFVGMAKTAGLTFIIDTEGSQVRTGSFRDGTIRLPRDAAVKIRTEPVLGDASAFSLRPRGIVEQLSVGDVIHVDFESSILRVVDVDSLSEGFIRAQAITSGSIASNKAVVVDPLDGRRMHLPALSPRDHQAIEIGRAEGIEHIAVSFVRSGGAVDEVREVIGDSMRIISKVECIDALKDLDAIVEKTDALLLDRGDLSKEIPMEKIPFVQRILIDKANVAGKPVYVATNLLETMIVKEKPTRAEIQDVISTVTGGAAGLTLAAETAIGNHPMECVNVLNRVISHAESVVDRAPRAHERDSIAQSLAATDYLQQHSSSLLVPPHGGRLVDRMLSELPDPEYLESIPKLELDPEQHLDAELIALGVYSPLSGFMGKEDCRSVINEARLADGNAWPVPVVLDAESERARAWSPGDVIGLTNRVGEAVALLHLEEKYSIADGELVFGNDADDAGASRAVREDSVMLGGTIDLLRVRPTTSRAYELTPRQLRRFFDERGWATVLALHSDALDRRDGAVLPLAEFGMDRCDGFLFHHSSMADGFHDLEVIHQLNGFERTVAAFYQQENILVGAFPSSRRFGGAREALRYAICAKNYGCSHIVVGGSFGDPAGTRLLESPAWRQYENSSELGVVLAAL